MKKFLSILLILCLGTFSANSQILKRNVMKKTEKELFGKSVGTKKGRQSGRVAKSKKKQEANIQKQKKDYVKSVKKSQQRTMDIQTPDVKNRMKENQKAAAQRDKIKKKKIRSGTKKAGKKYN